MSLLQLRSISLAFSGPQVLDGVSLKCAKGERIALVGRNGAGKSCLMKIIAGEIKPDSGEMTTAGQLRIARLVQDVPLTGDDTVFTVVASGLGNVAQLLQKYFDATTAMSHNEPNALEAMTKAQHALEAAGGWRMQQRVETVLSKLALPTEKIFSELSGGLKRRVLLAKALVSEPDLLLLDEPTNHLDLDAILWLEQVLINFNGTLIFVTHDRQFLQNIATRIALLDRGHLYDYPGDYDNFLRRQEERAAVENTHFALEDKKLAQEETWIRQGIKARRTRNEGRVRALHRLRDERQERRNQQGKVNVKQHQAELSGRIVIDVDHLSFEYEKPIVTDFSTTIMRGDKIGIIGPNGVGKTTFIKLLLKELTPTSGTVKQGTKLKIAYLDQLRTQLDESQTVMDNVGQGRSSILINGKEKHVIGYLQDFLFTPERARCPITMLSGGERNRLLLAKLFTVPANLFILDEPTNDLDIETIEVLESLLVDYQGTLLLISHDRTFLNNVVMSTIVFEGDGKLSEYVGGYDDYLRQKPKAIKKAESIDKTTQKSEAKQTQSDNLSYDEKRELRNLMKKIERLEAQQEEYHTVMGANDFYQQDPSEQEKVQQALQQCEQQLTECYARWEALEAKR